MLEKGLSFINVNKSNTVNTCFVCEILKILIWEHVEFDEGKSNFLLFFAVFHILSETEVWPFSAASSSMNSSEMQH